jgi:hypothetical protein
MHTCTHDAFTRHRAVPPTIAISQLHQPLLDGKPCLTVRSVALGALAAVAFLGAAWANALP